MTELNRNATITLEDVAKNTTNYVLPNATFNQLKVTNASAGHTVTIYRKARRHTAKVQTDPVTPPREQLEPVYKKLLEVGTSTNETIAIKQPLRAFDPLVIVTSDAGTDPANITLEFSVLDLQHT